MTLKDFIPKLEFGTVLRIWSIDDEEELYNGKLSYDDCKEIEAEDWYHRDIIHIGTHNDDFQIELFID